MADWTPPQKLLPITAPVYACLRMGIEAGNVAVTAYAKARESGCTPTNEGGAGCWVDTQPPVAVLAETYYQYVPVDSVSIEPAKDFVKKYLDNLEQYIPTEYSQRIGWPTFVDRKGLIKALDDVTPAAVKAQFKGLDQPPDVAGTMTDLPSANTDDPVRNLEWWVMALSAGGGLELVGRSPAIAAMLALNPASKAKTVVVLAARLLLGVGAAAATVTVVLPWVAKVAEKIIVEPVANVTKTASNFLGIAIGVGATVLIGYAVYRVIQNDRDKRSPRELAA